MTINSADDVVCVDYEALLPGSGVDLTPAIERAFGANDAALGIILIRNVPHFSAYRVRLLPMASTLAHSPATTLAELEDEQSQYMFGWSHGKELVNGKRDVAKGSFYANPVHDRPTEDPAMVVAHPEYCRGNRWPSAELPELRSAFRDLGGYPVNKKFPGDHPVDFLYEMVKSTRAAKARLLHYFPMDNDAVGSGTEGAGDLDSWCGWHLDHSCLTGLTAAMYLDDVTSVEVPPAPNDPSGLYIRNRGGSIVKVTIPEDCLAFQLGEALQLASRGTLRATPHCVRSQLKGTLARNTLAVFIQPDWTQELLPGLSFSTFTKNKLAIHIGGDVSKTAIVGVGAK